MNQLAVITGATGGIGGAIAGALAEQGYALLWTGRQAEKLSALQAELKARYDIDVHSIAADLTQPEDRAALVNAIGSQAQPFKLLVNNAGTSQFGLFVDSSDGLTEELIRTNVTAPICLTQAVLRQFGGNGSGVEVINIGSTFGIIGYPGFATYSASKFALRGFSQALAREYGDTDIRIRYFAPRATQTGLNSAAVNALNTELSVTMDSTEAVARAFSKFLRSNKLVGHIGWPERFFVWLNKLSPNTVGSALIKQLPVIRRHAKTA